MGREKVQVAQILKDHNVLVRGGPEQGTKLMEALVVGLLTKPPCSHMDGLHSFQMHTYSAASR